MEEKPDQAEEKNKNVPALPTWLRTPKFISRKSIINLHKALQSRHSDTDYNEYMTAMKRAQNRHSLMTDVPPEILSPRARYRKRESQKQASLEGKEVHRSAQEASRIGIIASMVPDEIIYKHHSSVRSYETALMFIDISGFTALCEKYTHSSDCGPSRLTQVLNSYIGAMVQEILTHNGDVLKFSGDAFLSMWKKTLKLTMQDVVHNAIDCGLIIQKNYGNFNTDVGITLKVKVAISAGLSHFSIIGGENSSQCNYVIVGQPVWDVKMAQYMTAAGDVLTTASAWTYVNEAEYCTQPCGDGRHTKVLGVGASWKRVEKLEGTSETRVRPAVVAALQSTWWWSDLRLFMLTPVLRAVDNDEPMDYLTEVRRVIVVFLNIITKTVTPDVLINIVDKAYKCVSSVASESNGLVNKVSMFDKDMMFLVVFGLRGLKHENEAQNAVLCAFELLEKLNDENILSVSIGVTSGTTYCGVVGHVLRREYTVIGPAVNKAARLMMEYCSMVTCDKETFLRSKLNQEYFRQLPPRPLKGIDNAGPIYQFSKTGWPERGPGWRHPALGRNEELKKFKLIMQNAIEQHSRSFTRYRDHKYAVVYSGCKSVGTTRMLDESLLLVPDYIRQERIVLKEKDMEPYYFVRLIMAQRLKKAKAVPEGNHTIRKNVERMIRNSLNTIPTTPLQLHALNIIFDCRFPLPEHFEFTGDILSELSVKNIIKDICLKHFDSLWVIGVDEAQYIDDESWRLLLVILASKTIFVIMAISNVSGVSRVAKTCIKNYMVVNIALKGIDRSFHAALTCQLLDVQAIPTDLEKVIESASQGLPGWIQNFVISLVQQGALTMATVSRTEAVKTGAVLPHPTLLERISDYNEEQLSIYSYISASVMSRQDSVAEVHDQENVQMAVLPESYTFENIKVDMTMDAIILKTYDSLTPFEKMLIKCGSVLGEVFSRRMLLHLLQSNSPRKVAQAVAKLFSIRVLECEGGDFTRDTSLVLVHPSPALTDPKPPYCACLGTRQPPSCRDLPMYAFCGYMKFRHSQFRTTTYDLLTENQKHELHSRALLYLERYTRRCSSCGGGCFAKLLGLRCDSGLIDESEDVKRTRRQISALSAEAKMAGEDDNISEFSLPEDWSTQFLETEGTLISRMLLQESRPRESNLEHKRVRSFSSLDLENCECLSILLAVYPQLIDHCQGAADYEKLFEAYMEYADLCININVNIPQGVRLLSDVEVFIKSKKYCPMGTCTNNWVLDFHLASVYSLRGVCMIETGDLEEARKQLFQAMKLYRVPFPTSKHWRKVYNMGESIRQLMALYVVPNLYIATESGVIGHFYEDIAKTLNILYTLFIECKEYANATLAAKWSLNYALRTNSNLRVLCISYANMIDVYKHKQKFSTCLKLEKRAMDSCRRKRGQLDVTEVEAVCYLYTNIFLFYVEWGKKIESLEFGLSVVHMLSSIHNSDMRQLLILWMLKLLLCDLKIHDMVAIMREFLYMTDTYDLCSEAWYYYYAVMILLDTGYCIESLSSCEKFYIKKGDSVLKNKTPEAAWNYFVAMWLATIRIGAWERAILWEEKIKQRLSNKFERNEFNTNMLIILIEGILITLVKEMDNRNIKKIMLLEKAIKSMFQEMSKACEHTPLLRPRYYLMLAYYSYIRGKKHRAFNNLNKARDSAKQYSHNVVLIWSEHTRHHWRGTLNPKYLDYWTEHVEPDSLLDYRDFDQEKGKIIPFTLPIPRDLEK
ncbi:adenylate cyclase type 10-like [Anticarsia gemmatalis]|uniref:adenylate cyclase type 10-like n=1 Tax=Anticarsia gemmatalis TaxID=129554 RepID=UPI003F775738